MNDRQTTYYRSFVTLLVLVSVAFAWLLRPYFGAIFWGTVLAISFAPLHRRLTCAMKIRPNLAALLTLLLCLFIVILPVTVLTGSLVKEGASLYKRVESGQLNLGLYFEQIVGALPPSVHQTLDQLGLADVFSIQEKLSAGAMQGSKFLATQAVNIGQNTFEFLISFGIMLYLLFFLLRDGSALGRKIMATIPLGAEQKLLLLQKFVTVVRATLKGNIVVAATQGLLGGIMFWFLGIDGALLWGVLMAFLSLLPAIGSAIIWLPVAIYFLVAGPLWQGVVLILFGVLVIGLVDNILRPLLVGKDTKMPDYVVLISTLGGLATFGLNGFVIGPLIAALFIAVWDLFPNARSQTEE
ncbi:MAG TPA: AI-2E family transporter [Eoetvoesiella sp.]|uniref:AI-2E family transporter n=1 Tax=Eoetvoesiella sp. TaxID=1966355 RepID=UPI002C61D45D|nr:AI-2E family transporter [Eoetvoesiella sp.]HWK63090.1 AI-2E family transporter [Eoetvoesiella sp.]